MDEQDNKPKVALKFELPDGSVGTRSKMEDFETLSQRIYERQIALIGLDEYKRVLLPGIRCYDEGYYAKALEYFETAIQLYPKTKIDLLPHIRICNRVAKIEMSQSDIEFENKLIKWYKIHRFIKYFKKSPHTKIICKYCGHYTKYIHSDFGFAYLETNNCQICSRGYPAPEFAWDGIDGQAYIYYRRSVTETEFYKEFEEQFDVNPDHTYFLK